MPNLSLFDGVVPFVTVAEAGSFLAAAKVLGVTNSALSKSVARLEAEVGARLLHRSSRAVRPTPEGEEFLRTCRDAVTSVRTGRARLDAAHSAPAGRLRVSLPTVLASRIIAGVPELLAAHPGLSLDIVTTDRFVQLSDERIDVALRIGAMPDSSNVARKLQAVDLVTCAAPSYLAKHGTPRKPDELSAHSCLSFVLASGKAQPWFFRGKSGTSPIRVDGALRTDDGETLLAAAVAGLGILQAPDVMVAADLAAKRLVRVLKENTVPGPSLYVLIAPGLQKAPRVRIFVEFVRKRLGRR